MKKLHFILLLGAIVFGFVFMCGCTGTGNGEQTQAGQSTAEATTATVTSAAQSPEEVALSVYHAGSLTAPMEEMEKAYEAEYPNVDVQLYAGGSTKLAKEITELQATADVYASADYTLIPDLMVPDYATWYVTFAKNRMVLCYTDQSKYADEVSSDNWYEILGRDGVAWAFSDPNLDPCGYRSLMVIQLAEFNYDDDMIFDNLVTANRNISVTEDNGVWTIHASDPSPEYPISISPKSVELIAGLEAGNLDYAWEYRSVAEQNADSGIKYIELPEAIDLSSIDYADEYAKVQEEVESGIIGAKPIVYGVTVPTTADNPDDAMLFVKMLIGPVGQQIMNDAGQPPIVPPVAFVDVPAALSEFVQAAA